MTGLVKNALVSALFIVALLLPCCGKDTTTQQGGTEAGNPPESTPVARLVRGKVPIDASTNTCKATKVTLTDSKDLASSSSVASDCSFSMSVNKGDASTISLFNKDTFTALMAFNHSTALFLSNTLVIGTGTKTIDFGQIQVSGTTGTAATEPATQNDQDGDGIVDFDDTDDDNDGVADVDERDCDLDGFLDTDDLDRSTCAQAGDIGSVPLQPGEDWVMEVLPRNQAKYVPIDQAIKIRANCAIDPSTLNSSTFNVGDLQGNHVACKTSLAASNKVIVCDHDNFLSGMKYTLTAEGLSCADHGGGIRTVTWHFTTAVPVN